MIESDSTAETSTTSLLIRRTLRCQIREEAMELYLKKKLS